LRATCGAYAWENNEWREVSILGMALSTTIVDVHLTVNNNNFIFHINRYDLVIKNALMDPG
jgi:hypothetical protein